MTFPRKKTNSKNLYNASCIYKASSNKKAQGISINFIIIVIIAVAVLIVILFIFGGKAKIFTSATKGVECSDLGCQSAKKGDCREGERIGVGYYDGIKPSTAEGCGLGKKKGDAVTCCVPIN